jgi:hypothetical protein
MDKTRIYPMDLPGGGHIEVSHSLDEPIKHTETTARQTVVMNNHFSQ